MTQGPAIGYTIFKEDTRVYPVDNWSDKPKQTICVDVDSQGFLDLYLKTMAT